MKQILSHQLYKTFHSVGFLLSLGFAFLFSWASVYFAQNISATFSELSDAVLETFHQGQYYNFVMLQVESKDSLRQLEWRKLLLCILNSNTVATLLAVCISKNVTNEFQYGGFFSAVARGCSRKAIYLAYLVSMVLLTIVLSGVYVLTFAIVAVSGGMQSGTTALPQMLYVILTQLFMLVGYAIFCASLALLLRRAVAAILVNVSIAVAMPAAFAYMRILYHLTFPFESYWVLSRSSQLVGRLPVMADYLSAIFLAVISLVSGMAFLNHIKIKNE